MRHPARFALLLCTLAMLAPSISRADTVVLIAPFDDAVAEHYTGAGVLSGRNETAASATAVEDGHLTGAASIDSRLAGGAPIVAGGSASAQGLLGSEVTLPDDLTELEIVAKVHVARAVVQEEISTLGYQAAGTIAINLLANVTCDWVCDYDQAYLFVEGPDDAILDQDVELRLSVAAQEGDYLFIDEPLSTGIRVVADTQAGLRKSSASAEYDLTLTSIEFTYR